MRRAIVTGCSRGIGRAVTEMLVQEHWYVLGLARTEPEDWQGFNWIATDLGQPDAMASAEAFLKDYGDHPFDALIHCAGIRGPFGDFLDNDADAWEQTIATNLIGTVRVLRAALPLLQKSDDARILLFSGGGAFGAEPGYSAYACTKGATVSLMETLAEELSNTSVTVNCVAPGFVPTDIHKGTPHEHRRAEPDAMDNAVACVRHLLSPAAQGLTGRTVSAAWDDWRNLTPWTIPHLENMGQRDRHLIAGLQRLLLRGKRAI